MIRKLGQLLVVGPRSGPPALAAFVSRLAAGWVFVAFGAGKFTSHASEVRSFRDYGLPAPDAFVYAIGVIEVVGGVLLIAGLATRVAALILAGDMVGAIVLDGIIAGAALSLTLAPALLAVMLFLLWVGPGSHAFDHRAGRLFAVTGGGSSAPSARSRHSDPAHPDRPLNRTTDAR